MKKIFLAAIALVLGLLACQKDDITVPPEIKIVNVSADTISINDTLVIDYTSKGIEDLSVVNVKIDNIAATIIKNDLNKLTVIVPYGITDGLIELSHPIGVSDTYTIDVGIKPHVTFVGPLEGVGGDTIIIKGWGFSKVPGVKKVIVNSLPVKLFVDNDTLIKGIIPAGCGSGKIAIQSYRMGGYFSDKRSYYFDNEIICGYFNYHFKPYSGSVYPSKYIENIEYGKWVTLIRNNQNAVIKKIYDENQFDTCIYNNSGLIDTIKQYNYGELTEYQTFLRHVGGEEIVENFYDENDKLIKYYIFKLLNGQISRWEFYERTSITDEFYFSALNQFIYNDDFKILDRVVYYPDGSEYYHPIYEGRIDIDNQPLDFGIFGDPLSKNTIWLYNSENTYHNYYNEYGLLVKRVLVYLGISEEYNYTTLYEY